MELSFWELDSFFRNRDLVVIGSGIVGLNAAISYKKKFSKANVLVLERGVLPMGASTKNAGFACFGSVSELLSDFEKVSESTVLKTVQMRLQGLKRLRKIVGDKNMDFENYGGNEVFDSKKKFEECADKITWLNEKLKGITNKKNTFLVNSNLIPSFGLTGFKYLIHNPIEGQINTGKMMKNLLQIASNKGITVLNNICVKGLNQSTSGVSIELSNKLEINCKNVIVATNGFAKSLMPELDVIAARAQVLITKPIKGLKLKGTFHYDEGYYYFRNIGDRILLGGGRNLDFEGEKTDEFGLTSKIQNKLNKILSERILLNKEYEIDHRWSGIMGLGLEKKPIVVKVSENIVVAVRMGGMGIAIGALVGELATDLLCGTKAATHKK